MSPRSPAFLAKPGQARELWALSQAYHCRPSAILGLADPWAAYDLDLAVLCLANRPEAGPQPPATAAAPPLTQPAAGGLAALMAAFPQIVTRAEPLPSPEDPR